MAVTESATITDEVARPKRVTAYGRDTNGVLRPLAVGTDGALQLDLTGEGLALDVSVDGLETLTGALTETAPATDTASSGLNGRLQRIAQRLTSLLAVTPGVGKGVAVTLTRTADTNAYAANDVVGAATGSTAALTFANIAAAAGEHIITSVAFEIDATAIISGQANYRLYLYNVTPPSALGDNVAWDLPSGDRASYLGYVDLGTPVDLGSTLYVEANAVNKQVTLASTSVFGYLVTIGAYTPASATVHVITMHTVPA